MYRDTSFLCKMVTATRKRYVRSMSLFYFISKYYTLTIRWIFSAFAVYFNRKELQKSGTFPARDCRFCMSNQFLSVYKEKGTDGFYREYSYDFSSSELVFLYNSKQSASWFLYFSFPEETRTRTSVCSLQITCICYSVMPISSFLERRDNIYYFNVKWYTHRVKMCKLFQSQAWRRRYF